MLTQFAQGNISRLREAIHDVFILWKKTCFLRPPESLFISLRAPTYISIQPSNEINGLKSAWASILPESIEVDSRLNVSCGAPLAPLPTGGHSEHVGAAGNGLSGWTYNAHTYSISVNWSRRNTQEGEIERERGRERDREPVVTVIIISRRTFSGTWEVNSMSCQEDGQSHLGDRGKMVSCSIWVKKQGVAYCRCMKSKRKLMHFNLKIKCHPY